VAAIFETERLLLRELTHRDLDHVAALRRSRGEASAWIGRNLAIYEAYGFGFWAIELGSEFAGYCGVRPTLLDRAPEWEIGWHISERLRDQGIATEAALGVRDFAFTDLGLTRLVALIDPGNFASRRVAENIGMRAGPTTVVDNRPWVVYEQSLELAGQRPFDAWSSAPR
jgi:RimJ/RimL family protein N-acetyltransferase